MYVHGKSLSEEMKINHINYHFQVPCMTHDLCFNDFLVVWFDSQFNKFGSSMVMEMGFSVFVKKQHILSKLILVLLQQYAWNVQSVLFFL